MAGLFRKVYDWLLRTFWATEMDVTMIGLQNAGKTSLLRVLSVRPRSPAALTLMEANVAFFGRAENSRSSKRQAFPNIIPSMVMVSMSSLIIVDYHCASHRIAHCATPSLRCHKLTFSYSSIPTVGFNMKRVQRGHVTLRCWDLGGQPRFRPMWERYCRGVNAIVFIVDIADLNLLPGAKDELHALMRQPSLEGIPLLVLGNKSDLPDKLTVDELIDALDLKTIGHREVSCYGISAKEETNLEAVIQWLMKWANK
ncbi:hypothetical protein SLS62_002795 [Diatrype stigma]|uniref:Uncharacterized protein n=1 Tax=Diatrype stigma TaxID=117547 RepID=A0AAN9UZQ3_9PEZI